MTDDAPYLLDVTRLIWRRWKGRHPTGVDRVCLAYMRHFGAKAQAVVQHDRFRRILQPRASQELFALLQGGERIRTRLPFGILRNLTGLDAPGEGRIYLNIGHTGLNSPGFRAWVARANVRPVYLVHDLIPITHPEFCRAGEADRHRDRMRTVLTTAAGVIGNSQATLDELAEFARVEDLPHPPSIAAWLGIERLPSPVEVKKPDRPTFLILGTIEARKNHAMLLRIWSRLIDRFGEQAPRLLIIGQRGWEADDVFELLDGSTKLRPHVRELSRCSDEELADHLASVRALLFPSLVEGYGLPLIEALSAGLPVIASDLPAFREIAGDIPDYIAPMDESRWEQAIVDYVNPSCAARTAQIERMKNFEAPTWAAHFARIEAWLTTLG